MGQTRRARLRSIQIRPAADADLTDIFSYSATTWGWDQAERYTGEIIAIFSRLAADPAAGKPASERHSSLRRHRCGSHLIIVKSNADAIEIVRILHQSMDIDSRLD
jgi:toxin ParE1/3/4